MAWLQASVLLCICLHYLTVSLHDKQTLSPERPLGQQIGCRGDGDSNSARPTSSLNMTVEIDPRSLPRRCKLEAVIRGGSLEAAAVVTRSPPVFLSIWASPGLV